MHFILLVPMLVPVPALELITWQLRVLGASLSIVDGHLSTSVEPPLGPAIIQVDEGAPFQVRPEVDARPCGTSDALLHGVVLVISHRLLVPAISFRQNSLLEDVNGFVLVGDEPIDAEDEGDDEERRTQEHANSLTAGDLEVHDEVGTNQESRDQSAQIARDGHVQTCEKLICLQGQNLQAGEGDQDEEGEPMMARFRPIHEELLEVHAQQCEDASRHSQQHAVCLEDEVHDRRTDDAKIEGHEDPGAAQKTLQGCSEED
mmetsp:Transcript_78257/g.162532  ORF Transcript_78257/g.162532 Transcript_78257/m.162532 type:complete len:260 (+) Transcript_78257:328-1107(+)